MFALVGYDQLTFFVLYIVAASIILSINAIIIKTVYKNLEENHKSTEEAKYKAEILLSKIYSTIKSLTSTNEKIKGGIFTTGKISEEIKMSTDDVSNRATKEVSIVNGMKTSITVGVEKVEEVTRAIRAMEELSVSTENVVFEGANKVDKISSEMNNVTSKITSVVNLINELSEENTKIVSDEILNEQKTITVCSEHTDDVKNLFEDLNMNTSNVLTHSRDVSSLADVLEHSMKNTFNSVNNISEEVETTVASMKEIFAAIDELNTSLV
ncbi:MAG: methyl-accepting chemotaxis protein [Clostridium beijerinckii]